VPTTARIDHPLLAHRFAFNMHDERRQRSTVCDDVELVTLCGTIGDHGGRTVTNSMRDERHRGCCQNWCAMCIVNDSWLHAAVLPLSGRQASDRIVLSDCCLCLHDTWDIIPSRGFKYGYLSRIRGQSALSTMTVLMLAWRVTHSWIEFQRYKICAYSLVVQNKLLLLVRRSRRQLSYRFLV
jgi:hypothetical protein